MNYIEWLRVRNCLRTVAIILAVLVVLAVVLRISLARYASPATWVANITSDPGTKITHSVPEAGTKRTVIDDPADRTHVVIDDRGSAGTHIVVTEPSGHSHHDSNLSHVGNVVSSHSAGGITTTVVDTHGSVPMIFYMAIADIVALIVATILAAPFAREIDGHLEIALTRPCSRVRFALGSIGVDVVGILASSLLTIVALYLCQLLFETWRLDFTGENALAIVMGAALPARLVCDALRGDDLAQSLLRCGTRLRLAGRHSNRRVDADPAEQRRRGSRSRRCLGALTVYSADLRASRGHERHRQLRGTWFRMAALSRNTVFRRVWRDCRLAVAARGGLIVEIIGTSFTLSLGVWRLRFALAIEENEEPPKERVRTPHRLRVVPEDEYVR